MRAVRQMKAEGPYFEDLERGQVFAAPASVTLTDGLAAQHQAIVGDRLRLPLDHSLSAQVTGAATPLAHPALVWDVAIGGSTTITHHVVANLFYRGLAFHRAPFIGDTLHTRTEIVALKENGRKPGRRPTGLAVLRITTVDQHERPVLDFWRCAMLPLRDPSVHTGHADDITQIGLDAPLPAPITDGWRLSPLRRSSVTEIAVGDSWLVETGDVVSSAPELARLTLNIASAHHDAVDGQRLVYGGHTIGLALSQAARALPDILTVTRWVACDHVGPVHEGDTLVSRISAKAVTPLAEGRLVDLRSEVVARAPDGSTRAVLDWTFSVVHP